MTAEIRTNNVSRILNLGLYLAVIEEFFEAGWGEEPLGDGCTSPLSWVLTWENHVMNFFG